MKATSRTTWRRRKTVRAGNLHSRVPARSCAHCALIWAYLDPLCLHATLLQLGSADAQPRVLTIPRDNRALVESACSAAALNALAEPEGSAWQKHRSELLGKAGAQAGAALYSLVDWSKPWHEAVAGELSTEARTRLGLDGIDLDLPSQPMGPFGRPVPGITVPAWMLDKREQPAGAAQTAPLVEDLQTHEGGFAFHVGSRRFMYSRHGLMQDASL